MAKKLTPAKLEVLLESGLDSEIRGNIYALPSSSPRDRQDPFPYQERSVYDILVKNDGRSGIVHLPTGAGKTRIAIELASRRLNENPNERIIWASHQLIVVRQGMARLAELAYLFDEQPRITFQWAETAKQHPADLLAKSHITFLTRYDLRWLLSAAGDGRTSSSPLLKALQGLKPKSCPRVTLIYDECHQLGSAKLQSAWRKFIKGVDETTRSRMRIVGFSATPLPTAKKSHLLLQEHVFPVAGVSTMKPDWQILVHTSIENEALVEQGVLCPVNDWYNTSGRFQIPEHIVRDAEKRARLKDAGRKPGRKQLKDFADRYNRKVMGNDGVLKFLADQIANNSRFLGKTLYFAPDIQAAEKMASLLKQRLTHGSVSVVHSRLNEFGDHTVDGRNIDFTKVQSHIVEFKGRGSAPCVMVNVNMLTTGFDDPKIRTVVLGRLTFSTNLFWQMIGRGLRGRRCGGTDNCNVIDPIRLTEKYPTVDGYRPRLRGEGYNPAELDADELGEGALRPQVPIVSVPPFDDKPVEYRSPELKRSVREALEAFLAGGPLTTTLVRSVVARPVETSDGDIGIEYGPANGEPELRGHALLERLLDSIEEECRGKNPRVCVDLGWMRTARYWPAQNTDAQIDLFEKRLKSLLKHDAITEQKFVDLERKLYENL